MPITLSQEEMDFVQRIRGYCAAGLNQPVMASRERMSLSGLRDKLRRCGLEFATRTEREIVRVKSTETLESLLASGQIQVGVDANPEPVDERIPA